MERFATPTYAIFPDDEHLLLIAGEPGRGPRGWLRKREDGDWKPATPEGVVPVWIRWSRDEVVGMDLAEGTWAAYPLRGGAPRALPYAIPRSLGPVYYGSADGRYGFLLRQGVPGVFERMDLDTGERTVWRALQPDDTIGLGFVIRAIVRPDVDAYVYSYARLLQELYLIEGLQYPDDEAVAKLRPD